MAATEAQQKALDAIFARVGKKYGAGAVTTMTRGQQGLVRGVIAGPLEAVNRELLGIGGLAWERITELYGPESSGKSSLVMGWVAAVQQGGGVGYYVDAENVLTQERAEVMGVDRENLVMSPDIESAEHAGELLLETLAAVPKMTPFLGVWDSVAVMETKAEVDDGSGMSAMARFLSSYCKKLVRALKNRAAHVIFVNQIREKPGVVYGNPEYTPGGKALKFYSSVRLRTRAVKTRDGGLELVVKSVKNKLAEPHKEVTAFLDFKKGWDNRWTTLELAKDKKLISNKSQSLDEARKALGWHVATAAEQLGAPPGAAGKISKRKGKE